MVFCENKKQLVELTALIVEQVLFPERTREPQDAAAEPRVHCPLCHTKDRTVRTHEPGWDAIILVLPQRPSSVKCMSLPRARGGGGHSDN